MMRSAVSFYRGVAPVLIFTLLILTLMASALFSIGDLIAARRELTSETELLMKLKDRAARSNGRAALNPSDYLFVAASQGVATGELQRRVSELLTSSGAELQLSEIIPSDPDGEVGRLAIAINFEIDEAQVIGLLHAVENVRPALLIERLSLRVLSSGQSAGRQRLQGTATFVAAWRIAS